MTATEALQVLENAVLAALVTAGHQGALHNEIKRQTGISNSDIVSTLLWELRAAGLATLPAKSKRWHITDAGRTRASALIMAHTPQTRTTAGNDDVPGVE